VAGRREGKTDFKGFFLEGGGLLEPVAKGRSQVFFQGLVHLIDVFFQGEVGAAGPAAQFDLGSGPPHFDLLAAVQALHLRFHGRAAVSTIVAEHLFLHEITAGIYFLSGEASAQFIFRDLCRIERLQGAKNIQERRVFRDT